MRRKTKPHTLPLGTIIHGTGRMEDIITALLDAAASVRMSAADRAKVRALAREAAALTFSPADEPDADMGVYDELEQVLGSYVPDYCYFGAHEGDGSDVGVWPVADVFEHCHRQGGYDGLVWHLRENSGPAEESIPEAFSHALAVNDHGNATLYRRAGRRWLECWSIV